MSSSKRSSSSDDKSKVTAESYGKLQDIQTGKECWMLRVTNKLADAFDNAPEGTVLGELVFRKGGGKNSSVKPSLDIHVADNITTMHHASSSQNANPHLSNGQLPGHYSLVMTTDVPTMHPFTRHPNGSIKLHGTVTRSGNMQVVQDQNYRDLLKDRIIEKIVHRKAHVKTIDQNQVAQQIAARGSTAAGGPKKGGFGEAVSVLGKRLLEANEFQQSGIAGGPANKKQKRFADDMPTKTIVFKLYEEKPFWTLKDLKLHSGRPESEIKEILKEIATYERGGENKNSYVLNKEYQVTKKSTDRAGDGSDGKSNS